jgi:hypothetical protein
VVSSGAVGSGTSTGRWAGSWIVHEEEQQGRGRSRCHASGDTLMVRYSAQHGPHRGDHGVGTDARLRFEHRRVAHRDARRAQAFDPAAGMPRRPWRRSRRRNPPPAPPRAPPAISGAGARLSTCSRSHGQMERRSISSTSMPCGRQRVAGLLAQQHLAAPADQRQALPVRRTAPGPAGPAASASSTLPWLPHKCLVLDVDHRVADCAAPRAAGVVVLRGARADHHHARQMRKPGSRATANAARPMRPRCRPACAPPAARGPGRRTCSGSSPPG